MGQAKLKRSKEHTKKWNIGGVSMVYETFFTKIKILHYQSLFVITVLPDLN